MKNLSTEEQTLKSKTVKIFLKMECLAHPNGTKSTHIHPWVIGNTVTIEVELANSFCAMQGTGRHFDKFALLTF